MGSLFKQTIIRTSDKQLQKLGQVLQTVRSWASPAGAVDSANPTATAEFQRIPERIVTDYAANGATISGMLIRFDNQITAPLRTPRSVRYSLQLDRGITKDLTARVGLLERFTKNDLLVEPFINAGGAGTLSLSSRGRSRYDELQFLLAYNNEKLGQLNASYVFSRSRGDLNTTDNFFGNTPAFVVRPNEYGHLPFDVPHRFCFTDN